MPSTTASRPCPSGRRRLSSRMPAILPPSTSTSFGHFSRHRRPAGSSRTSLGHGKRGDEAELGGRGRRAVGPQEQRDDRDCPAARPSPAAPAAPAGLLARPDERAFRRAGVGQALRFVVGAADAVERDQPIDRSGSDGRRTHPRNSEAAAAPAAARRAAPGSDEEQQDDQRRSRRRIDAAPSRPAGRSASAGSSKYITLTMRR